MWSIIVGAVLFHGCGAKKLPSQQRRASRDQTNVLVSVQPSSYGSPELIQRGKMLFEEHCVRCHGVDGHGTPVQDVEPSPRSLHGVGISIGWAVASKQVQRNLVQAMVQGGRYGTGGVMPKFGDDLTPEEIWAIVSYIENM